MIDKYFPVLDKGFIALKDFMGSDEDIEQAARVSYGKGTRKKSETRGLIRYLISHHHTTPLEMCEIKLHVRVPMDCWRQWIRHRTASVNEYSTRYSEAINLRQETPPDKWRLQSVTNKQGSNEFLPIYDGNILSSKEKYVHSEVSKTYNERLDAGVAREQARKDLTLSTYTEAYWKIDLHNLLHFLKLRCNNHAQYEIRQYANIIACIVRELFPMTFEAWCDYSHHAYNWSRLDQEMLCGILYYIRYESLCPEQLSKQIYQDIAKDIGMTNREIDEFIIKTQSIKYETLILPEPKPYSYFKEDNYEKNNKMA